jgi:hypothetical protein
VNSDALFGLSILMSFIAFGIVTKLCIWPRLRVMPREDALIPLVVPHTFRFVGLSFLIPGVVSSSLSSAFAIPAAYGDLVRFRMPTNPSTQCGARSRITSGSGMTTSSDSRII